MMLGSALATLEERDRIPATAKLPPCALIHTPLNYIGGLSAMLMAIMNGTRIVVPMGDQHRSDAIVANHSQVSEYINAPSIPWCNWASGSVSACCALLFSRLLSSMLRGVSAFDPFTLVSVVVVLIAVGLFASLMPALRAIRVDPVKALRSE